MANKMRGKDLIRIGFPKKGNSLNIALGLINRYRKKEKKETVLQEAKEVLKSPEMYINDTFWAKVAEGLTKPVEVRRHELMSTRAPFKIFGEDAIDDMAKYQLYSALKLPIAKAGALMPDGHAGYGLPIGGVLACENAVIPYGVGVDIGCRMRLSVFPIPVDYLKGKREMFERILQNHTKFGMSETHDKKMDHELFSRSEFQDIPILKQLKKKAYDQLGTSGGGNHFVEFGALSIYDETNAMNLSPGKYLALLTHSGSRGLGANVAKHYTYLAKKQCPLPKNVEHLAWLDLNTHDGKEYWLAMNLAGEYAKACHDNIHYRISKLLGTRFLASVENHHNFAWKEVHQGQELIVHRKGATPASKGAYGIIPGTMTEPGFLVRGKGNEASLNSASHGAGRKHSRSACKSKFTKSDIRKKLKTHGVSLIGGSVDEAPMAYKDIHKVMEAQTDLIEIVGKFEPKIVRMNK
ncbi:MAG: RtcB family protein [Flavobacteriales bacterium]|jgi:tRNA-splicing ligase RtcB|nr:RtcB family protein [Flavobacteriales bacterium]